MQSYKEIAFICLMLFASCTTQLKSLQSYALPDGSRTISAAYHAVWIHDHANKRLITVFLNTGNVYVTDSTAATAPITKGGAQ